MKRHCLALFAALLASACSSPDVPVRNPASDARAIAKVERLNTVPAMAIAPQPITFADIERNDLFGAGCYFLDGSGEARTMLFLASDQKGWLKLEGRIVALSADRGSDKLPYSTWTKYVGLANTVRLTRDAVGERQTGPETASAPGTIVIRDAKDRTVYKRSGIIECGA
jgi:hypothetical protein